MQQQLEAIYNDGISVLNSSVSAVS